MKQYTIDIENIASPKKGKNARRLNILLGAVFLLNGLNNIFLKENYDPFFTYLYLALGPALIITGIIFWNKDGKYFITFDEKGIKAKTNLLKEINLHWTDIEKIQFQNLKIILISNGKNEEIELDELKYKEVLETKEKLKEFAENKNITIE